MKSLCTPKGKRSDETRANSQKMADLRNCEEGLREMSGGGLGIRDPKKGFYLAGDLEGVFDHV